MRSFFLALLSTALIAGPGATLAVAQTVAPADDGQRPAIETPRTVEPRGAVERALIRARPRVPTDVPENAPRAVDLGLVGIEGVAPTLIKGVTLKAFTRFVRYRDRRIGQVVLTGLEKAGRIEALAPERFNAQFDLERPRLEPEREIRIEGDLAALRAALGRLAEAPDEEQIKIVVDGGREPGSGLSAAARGNREAAGYEPPRPLPARAEAPEEEIRVTAEGCPIRVDIARRLAIQQSRTVTLRGGTLVSESGCTDSAESYPLQKSYSVCTDAIDMTARTASARFVLFYTGPGGAREDVSDCLVDPDRIFAITESFEACGVFLDYDLLKAVPQSALVYLDDSNREIQVRGCQASETRPAVELVLDPDLCPLRHDYAGGRSHQQGAYIYRLDGFSYQAAVCTDTGVSYRHETVWRDSGGAEVCEIAVDLGQGQVIRQFRKRIAVEGVHHYVTECAPDPDGPVPLHATTDGCDDPAAWTHDLAGGHSYGEERFYYLETGARRYVGGCVRSAEVYAHQVETAGWQAHDGQLFAYALSTVWIEPPSGRHYIVAGALLPGSQQMPYELVETVERPTGEVTYEGCQRFEATDRIERWRRPDTTVYEKGIGPGDPQGPLHSCTTAEESRTVFHSTRLVHGAVKLVKFCMTPLCSIAAEGWTEVNWSPGRRTRSDLEGVRSCVISAGYSVTLIGTHFQLLQVRTVTTYPDGSTTAGAWEDSGQPSASWGFVCATSPPPVPDGE